MADNVTADPGAGGATFATDDDGIAHHPYVKLEWGADNTQTKVATGAGALPIQDGGNSITVDGTVAVSAVAGTVTVDGSGVTQPVSNAGLTELAAAINVSSQLDVNIAAQAGALTVASHAVTNAGTFATQVDGAALTALQLIDDTVFTDDAAFTAATSKVQAVGGIVTSDSVDAGDVGAFAMLANRQQKVTLYDSGGVELAVGGGTQYTEDAAAAANPVGNALIVIREDARAGSLTSADGDNVALRGNNLGELYVKHTDSIAVTNAGLTELAAAINGSSQMDVNIAASAATLTVASHNVTNAGTFAVQATVAAGATNIAKAEDAASADADVGVPAMAVRKATPANTSGADGDYEMLQMSAGRLWVDPSGVTLTVASHAVTNAGTFATQVDGAALTALQLIDNASIADDAAFTPATTGVNMVGFFADETATDSVDEGDGGAARMTLDRRVITVPQGHASGGLTIFRSIDLDETEEEVKASAGCVYGMWVTNTATTTRWVKFYNATAASVTVGTTTPVITIGIPGNTSDDISGSFGPGGVGIQFDTAITVAATTGVADADTGAPAANDVIVNIFYK